MTSRGLLAGGGNEGPGWRGFALPRLINASGGSVPAVAVLYATFDVALLWITTGLPAESAATLYWIGVGVVCVLAAGVGLGTR